MPLGSYRLSQYLSMPSFKPIAATGGSSVIDKTDDGKLYRYHVFTGTSNFVVSDPGTFGTIEYWIVAGGGGGGGNQSAGGPGAGGGAGGLLTNLDLTPLAVSSQSYTITIGGGGARSGLGEQGITGSNSIAFGLTAAGGGGGGRGGGTPGLNGLNGGSGGGAGPNNNTLGTPGTGISGQGFAGGQAIGGGTSLLRAAGGGGGASEVGANATNDGTQGQGGNGGDGRFFEELETIVGTTGNPDNVNVVPGWIAGGGGGGSITSGGDITTVGQGGKGGGARGGAGLNPNQGINAQVNSGGGGGGGGRTNLRREGGGGGSGIIIIRYPLEA